LALADEDPMLPKCWTDAQFLAFLDGLKAGWMRMFQDRANHAAYLDSLPLADIPFAELVEAGGVEFARRFV
jgi:hypothetical protein